MSVRQVLADQHKLDGQTVLVRGWMIACRTMWCRLTQSPGDPGRLPEGPYQLSVGGDDAFQRDADSTAPAEIILKAKVDASCRQVPGEEAIPVCADGTDLQPIEIVRVVRHIDKRFK
jgi:hypothetical protein